MPAAGDQAGADAVAVHRGGGERGDRVLVQVRGDDDPGAGGAELVQLAADPVGEQGEVAGVDPHGAQLGAGHLDGGAHGLPQVVGVDQQGGAPAHRVDLRPEGVPLAVVDEGEGVRRGPGGRDAVGEAGLQVGGGGEAGHVGGAGGGDGGPLVRAPGAHLDHRASAGRGGHPGRGGGDRRIVVEDREDHRLQDHPLGEAALDGEQWGAGEVDLALGVAVDVAGEPVVGEEAQGLLVDDPLVGEPVELGGGEAEALHRVQDPAGAGDHAVAPARGQPAGEHLEDGAAVCRPAAQGGLEHGELVAVGEQRGRAGRSHGSGVHEDDATTP